eukprot:scaffold283_cov110-Isochrysis_galbana.AAC.3
MTQKRSRRPRTTEMKNKKQEEEKHTIFYNNQQSAFARMLLAFTSGVRDRILKMYDTHSRGHRLTGAKDHLPHLRMSGAGGRAQAGAAWSGIVQYARLG